MRVRSSLKWVIAFAALALAAGPAGAQTPPPPSPAPPASGTSNADLPPGVLPAAPPDAPGSVSGTAPGSVSTGAGSAGTDGQVGFQQKANLSPQEQISEAQRNVQKMETAKGGVNKTLDDARRARDVVKTLCLTDKLSQIDVAIKSAKDRQQLLQAAVTRNDGELSSHEFTILTVLRQRVEQLVAEANQCIGEESAFIGDTRTSVQVDPQIPPDETPYPATDPSLVIGPPQCTSCTQ